MPKFIFILFIFFSFRIFSLNAASNNSVASFSNASFHKKPNPLFYNFLKKQSKRKKIIATALAFPIPGGILGLHRIYLGTKPYVPLMYIFTLGGGFFILPIIDFFVLLINKDITRFENNPRIIMWIDNEKKSSDTGDKKTEPK